ncbi:MAG: hypothetical protein WED01_08215 [Candidatus Rokuibacteriota bacterium]
MQARLQLAVVLTIFAVSYVVVPRLASLLDTMGSYNPAHYEPKDADRAEWLRGQGDPDAFLSSISGETLFSIALFLLVAVVWLTLVPERSPRRRPPSR